MAEIFVGRQPIYTRDLNVYAYELMSHPLNNDSIADDKATAQIIINSFMEIGIDNLVGKKTAFITLSEHFLQNDLSSLCQPSG